MPFAMEATNFHLFLLSLSLLLIFLTRILRKNRRHRDCQNHMVKKILPPTLPSLPILGHLHLLNKPLHQALTDLADSLGPVIFLRFGSRPVVSISSPELAEFCLTTHGATPIRHEASVAELLSSLCLRSAVEIRSDEIHQFLRELFLQTEAAAAEWSVGGAVRVELKSRLFGLAIDVVMRMVAGRRFYGNGTVGEGKRFQVAVEELFGLRRASNVGELVPWLRWVDMVDVGQRMPRFREQIDELLQELIEERRGAGKEERADGEETMIDLLQSLQLTDSEKYNDSFIKEIVISFITAGTETVSNTIEWAMSLLLNNPERLKKVTAEIDDCTGRHRLLCESDLPYLPYLHCIISETLRLYPAAPVIVAHESSTACTIDGYDVPSGTMLLVNIYSIHRNPEVWQDSAKFIPERFQSSRAEGSVVLPFGQGQRRCPGEGLAGRVIGLVLGSMIQCFDWEKVGKEDMKEGVSMTLPKLVPLEAVCSPRPLLHHLLERL